MKFVGIDPDTTHTGVCIIDAGKIDLFIVSAKGRFAVDRLPEMSRNLWFAMSHHSFTYSVAAVEHMHLRPRGEKNPNAILAVQSVVGAAVCALTGSGMPTANIRLPVPQKWKGSVSKEAHQKRILAEAGLTLLSPEFEGIPRGRATHCIDALGLALWAKRNHTP